jgi:hypothetical protein
MASAVHRRPASDLILPAHVARVRALTPGLFEGLPEGA